MHGVNSDVTRLPVWFGSPPLSDRHLRGPRLILVRVSDESRGRDCDPNDDRARPGRGPDPANSLHNTALRHDAAQPTGRLHREDGYSSPDAIDNDRC